MASGSSVQQRVHYRVNTVNRRYFMIESSLNNGLVHRFRDRVSFRFLGIRYASQPQRFKYSAVYQGKNDSISALSYGSPCVQLGVNGSEDCLFLNIWTPFLPADGKVSKSELKPVMFNIHGGNFSAGSGSDSSYDGGNLASRGDVVVVTINYRLTTLGFFALDDGVTNGNFGFADQIIALEWVQANIRDFGGDPDKITIMGQSAGAAAVRALLASPKSIGKFVAAIPQSNPGGSNIASADSVYYTIPEEVSISGTPILTATGCINATSHLDCLRAYDAQALVELSTVAK
jgi:carboxylesterase type B